MIDLSQIEVLRREQTDFQQTEDLKRQIAELKKQRDPFFLNAREFDQILRWKLDHQFNRQRVLRSANTDNLVREVTRLALSVCHEDEDYEIELRLNILRVLRGVGVPVASAVLALSFPENYAVIDFRVWRQLFDDKKDSFSVNDYKRYLSAIRPLADELDWPVQEVDYAIWEFDRRQNNHGCH